MPRTHRAYWSLAAILSLLISALGCERGIIVRGDMGLEFNHAPPVAGACGPQGCQGQGGYHGPSGFAQGPRWPAKPYRHPRFHALPIGPVFDPQVMPAAYIDPRPQPMGSGTRQQEPRPHLASPQPPSELWIEPPEDTTYELPEPESSSYREPVEQFVPVDGPELQNSSYQQGRTAMAVRPSTSPESSRWTRPQRLRPQRSRVSRPTRTAPNRYPAWTPSRHGTSQRSYR